MGVAESVTRQGTMKASICLLLFMYVSYVLTAAAGGDGDDQGRKKRSADGYSNDYSTYYGAGPSTQYQTLGFGMAGQQPYYGKMKYTDPLFGERYKAWLAGQAMYGFRMKPTKPVLQRNHWYLRHLLKKGMYAQYQALRTPGNSLWKQYGFSLYGNAGNGKYKVPGQKYRKKRSAYSSYGNSGYGSGYGSNSYGGYSDNSYGSNSYGGYSDNSYGNNGYGSYNNGGYGNNDYGNNNYGSYNNNGYSDSYGSSGNYNQRGYGSYNDNSGYSSGYRDNNYGTGYNSYDYFGGSDNDYSTGGYSKGGGYRGGGYGSGGYSRKKRSVYNRSMYNPMVHGVKGYYGKGFQALAKYAALGPWTYSGAGGWGGFPGKWGHTYNSFPWTGSMFYNKKFNYNAYNLANILGKYSNKPKYY